MKQEESIILLKKVKFQKETAIKDIMKNENSKYKNGKIYFRFLSIYKKEPTL